MPNLEEFKFIVQPVLFIWEDGKVVGEQATDPVAVYGLTGLREFCDKFPNDLQRLNAEMNGQVING